jgi:predicted transcriptional regulator
MNKKFSHSDLRSVHIGALIEQKVRESMNISGFANILNCERKTVYGIFKQQSIDIDLLMKISEILDFDFIQTYYVKKKLIISIDLTENTLEKCRIIRSFLECVEKDTEIAPNGIHID